MVQGDKHKTKPIFTVYFTIKDVYPFVLFSQQRTGFDNNILETVIKKMKQKIGVVALWV
jgi:hypothetical protein